MNLLGGGAVFRLQECNPATFINKEAQPTPGFGNSRLKGKHEILRPGNVSHHTVAGGQTRVYHRGEMCYKDGNPYNVNPGKPCWWHRHHFEGRAMGIPIKIDNETGVKKVFMDGIYCSYSCALADLEEEMAKVLNKRNPNFHNSRTLLFQLYNDEFPGEELIPAVSWKNIKDVGNGEMTLKEFMTSAQGMRMREHPNYNYYPVGITNEILSK